MTMIRCALESPDLGQAFKYLERYHITHRKFSRATWSRKVCKKLMKVRNFETLSCLWKVKFCLSRIFLSVASFLYIIMSWFDVRWKAFIMDKLFNILNSIISHIKNFLESLEVEKFVQKLMSKLFWKIRNNQKFPDILINNITFFNNLLELFQNLVCSWSWYFLKKKLSGMNGVGPCSKVQKEWLRAPSPHNRQDKGLTIRIPRLNHHL